MPGMMKGSMYKKGGAVKKDAMKFQEGGPVRQPGKRRIMEGGPKGLPMMTPEQRRAARESMTPEERREADAPLTAEEVRRMGTAFKKGGAVKKMFRGGAVGGQTFPAAPPRPGMTPQANPMQPSGSSRPMNVPIPRGKPAPAGMGAGPRVLPQQGTPFEGKPAPGRPLNQGSPMQPAGSTRPMNTPIPRGKPAPAGLMKKGGMVKKKAGGMIKGKK